jgi:hypothetical protein
VKVLLPERLGPDNVSTHVPGEHIHHKAGREAQHLPTSSLQCPLEARGNNHHTEHCGPAYLMVLSTDLCTNSNRPCWHPKLTFIIAENSRTRLMVIGDNFSGLS